MKINHLLLVVFTFFFTNSLLAQNTDRSLLLKNGSVQVTENIRQSVIDSFNTKAPRYNGKAFLILQFETLPNEEIKKQLSANGIELLEYIPNNAYTASISRNLKLDVLITAKTRAIIQLLPEQKMEAKLAQQKFPFGQ